jgi:hypothetical protein
MDVVRPLRAADSCADPHWGPTAIPSSSALGLAWRCPVGDTSAVVLRRPRASSSCSCRGRDSRRAHCPTWVLRVAVTQRRGAVAACSARALMPCALMVFDLQVTIAQYGDANSMCSKLIPRQSDLHVVQAIGLTLDATIATCSDGPGDRYQGFRTTCTTADSLRAAVRWWRRGRLCTA